MGNKDRMCWKRILLIACLLLVVLILAIYVVVELYDFNRFKPVIAKAVKDATGRELVIDGDIEIDWGLNPGIRIEAIRFRNAGWGSRPDAVTVGSIEIEVALFPLILGRFEIPRLLVDAPDILLERGPGGTTNFSFESGPAEGKPDAAMPKKITIDEFIVHNGRFIYRDETPDAELVLALDRLETDFDFETNRVDLSLQGMFQQVPFQIQGNLDRPLPAILAGRPLGADFRVQLGSTEITLAGRLEDPSHLQGLDLDIDAAGPSLPATLALAGIKDIPDPGAFRLTANLTGSSEALSVDELAFKIGTPQTAEVAIEGRIDNLFNGAGADLVLSVRGENLQNLDDVLNARMPPYGAFSINARVSQPELNLFRLAECAIDIDETDLRTDLTLDLRQARPLLSGQVDTRRIDLLPLFAENDRGTYNEEQSQTPENSPQTTSNRTPFDDLLKAVDADVTLNTGDIVFPWMKLTEMQTRVRLQKGVAQVAIEGPALPDIETLADISRLQELGAFRLTGELSMGRGALALRKIEMQAGTLDQAQVSVSGDITAISAGRGFNLVYTIRGDEAANLGKYLIQPWPCRGKFTLSGRMIQPQGYNFEFPGLSGRLGDIDFRGRVRLALNKEVDRVHIAVAASKFNLKPFALGDVDVPAALRKVTDFGPLNVSLILTVPSGPLGLENLDLSLGTPERLALNLKGAIADLEALQGLKLDVALHSRDLGNLDEIIGTPSPLGGAFSAVASLREPAPRRYRFEPLTVNLGGNRVAATVGIDLNGGKPFIQADVRSETFDLRPMMPEPAPAAAISKATFTEDAVKSPRFLPQLPFAPQRLTEFNTKAHISIASLQGAAFTLDTLDGRVALTDGRLTINFTATKIYEVDELETYLDPAELGSAAMDLQAEVVGDRLTIHASELRIGGKEVLEIRLSAKVDDYVRQNGLLLEADVRCQQADILSDILDREIPYEGPFEVAARLVDPDRNRYKIETFRIVAGENDLDGRAAIDLTGERPRIDAKLVSNVWDLRPLFKKSEQPPTAPAQETQQRRPIRGRKTGRKVFSDQPIDLAFLEWVDLRLVLDGNRVVTPYRLAENLHMEAVLENGNLTIRPLKFIEGGGTFEGELLLHSKANENILSIKVKIEDHDIGETMQNLGLGEDLAGFTNGSMDVYGPIGSLAEFMGRLNGRIGLNLTDGRVNDRYISLLFGSIQDNLIKLANPYRRDSEFTEIDCFINLLEIKDGIATESGLLDTPQTTLVFAGTIDLRSEKLDITFKSNPKGGVSVGRFGRVGLSLGALTQPFKLGGTLAEPSLAIDPSETAVTFGKLLGAFALVGPAGLAVIFGDVSVGEAKSCQKALENANRIIDQETPENQKP